MPAPSIAQLKAAITVLETPDLMGSAMRGEPDSIYQAFVNACPQFQNAPEQISAWTSLLVMLADDNFSASARYPGKQLRGHDGTNFVVGPRVDRVVAALKAEGLTLQQIARVFCDEIGQLLSSRGLATSWSRKHRVDVPPQYSFSAAGHHPDCPKNVREELKAGLIRSLAASGVEPVDADQLEIGHSASSRVTAMYGV